MAIIDPRLLPLIETLVAADVDWLAFEILEGVQVGEVLEESFEKLRLTQERVRSTKRLSLKEHGAEESVLTPVSNPRTGNAQLLWAARYINQRLWDAVSMVSASFDQIEVILSTLAPKAAPPSPVIHGAVTVVLQQPDEREATLSRNGAGAARAGLEQLQLALNAWLESAGVPERTE